MAALPLLLPRVKVKCIRKDGERRTHRKYSPPPPPCQSLNVSVWGLCSVAPTRWRNW